MKLTRFRAILAAYGAQPERWPEGERAAAEALARSSLEAARALAEARALDRALISASLAGVKLEQDEFVMLKTRIVAAARPLMTSKLARWLGFDLTPLQVWPSLAGLALATVLGFGVGVGGLLGTSSTQEAEDGSVLSLIDFPVASE